MLSLLKKADRLVILIEEVYVGVGVLATTFLVFAGVVSRFVFKFSFTWVEEITQYIMLWVAFIGCVLCVKRNDHVGVDLIFNIIPKKYKKILIVILSLASGVFLCYFAFASWILVKTVRTNYQVSVSMTWLPIYVVYLSAPIGAGLMAYEFFKLAANTAFRKSMQEQAGTVIPEEKV